MFSLLEKPIADELKSWARLVEIATDVSSRINAFVERSAVTLDGSRRLDFVFVFAQIESTLQSRDVVLARMPMKGNLNLVGFALLRALCRITAHAN